MPGPIHNSAERAAITASVGYPSRLADEFYTKWIHLRFSAKGRDAECLLTFKQYVKLAKKAGITSPEQIGKFQGAYQMGRRGDVGDYEWGNCRFITNDRNHRELTKNGGRIIGDMKRAKLLRGRTKETHAGIAAQAEKIARSFEVTAPGGKVYRGHNLRAFALEHGLNSLCMANVCGGRQKQHRRWTGRYTD